MTSKIKTYFLSPNFEYPPGGLISLGSLITDPEKPERCLNKGKQIAIPPDEIYKGFETKWERSRSELRETKVGIWATFLQIVGFGGNVGYTHKHDASEIYKCARLETEYFQPDEKFIFETLQNERVQAFLKLHRWPREPVYMITGLKIAKGFRVESKESKTHDTDAKAGVDSSGAGVPIQLGPEFKMKRWVEDKTKFGGSSDCVFAYQVIRIKSKKDGKISEEDYNRGAVMNDDVKEVVESLETFREDWDVGELDLVERQKVNGEDGEGCVIVNTL